MRLTWPLVPGVFRFGQAMVDVGFGAGELEGMGAEMGRSHFGRLSPPVGIVVVLDGWTGRRLSR